MFRHRGAGRSLPALTLVLAASVALVGCGGATASVAPSAAPAASAAPSVAPTPSPTPAPTPSPTPADVSAAFLKIISDKEFSGTATLTGTLSVGPTKGDLSGTYAGDGDSSSSTLKITAGTFSQVTDSIGTGGKDWTRTSPGPWLEDLPKAPGTHKSLAETLQALGAVTDLGVETHAGKQLHHLRPKAGGTLTADQVGFDLRDATDAEFTMDFYATDDGTPASMVLAGTWTQGTGAAATKTTIEAEYTFTSLGVPHTVEPPTDVWQRYTSTVNGYTMAHPASWTVKGAKDKDSYLLGTQPYVYVGLTPFKGTTEAFAAALKKSYAKTLAGQPKTETASRLDGEASVRLTYKFKNDAGQDVTLVDDVASRRGTGWEIFVVTAGGPEDIAIFDQFVATFGFDK